MDIDILSLFPEYFSGPFDVSLLKRAQDRGLLEIKIRNIRDFGEGKHRTVDDRPYGGGPGMVLKPGPISQAIKSVRRSESRVIMLSPQGHPLSAAKCKELAQLSHLVLVCGAYEAVDERVLTTLVDEEISIGDYVLTSGDPAAVVLVNALSRYIPGVIGHEEAAANDSFEEIIFDGPHYTKPEVFEGMRVPEVLLSGHHAKIDAWRREQAILKTKQVRPDLFEIFEKERELPSKRKK